MKSIATFKCFSAIVFAVIFSLFQNKAFAVTNTYSSNGTWATSANWSLGTPTAGQDIVIAANCNIGATLTISLNSITVNAGKTLQISANTTFTVTTLMVYGTLINNGVTSAINATNVTLDATTGAGDIDLGSGGAATTNLNISGNLTGVSGGYVHHTTGGSTGNINFNGTNVVQTWNDATTFGDKVAITVNGTNNTLQLLTAMTLSPKSTVAVNSGDTLDCKTFLLSGMTSSGNGIFTLNSGASIKIGSSTGLNGNISTNIDTRTFNGGTTTYIYSGTGNQVTGTELPATVENLTIRNTGAIGSNIVTTSQAINVSGAFKLGGGLLTTTTGNILTLNAGATSTSGTTASYVNGPMAKTGNTAFVFPIGGSGRFMPLGISAPATATNTITSQYFFVTPVNPYSVNAPLINASLLEYWTMSETVTANSVDVTLNWQNGPKSGIYVYSTADLRVADYTGGSWHNLGASTVLGTYPTTGSVTAATTITNFSNLPITFGSTNLIDPLPITLTSFNATYISENNSVLINWEVASQLNNKEFVIEKTTDGINYTEVATLAGAGTTPFSNSYSAVDYNPYDGVSYYRLKQTDEDGNSTEFADVPVSIGTITNSSVSVYPNPAITNAVLTYTSDNSLPVTLTITDLSGKTISSSTYTQVQKGENSFIMNTTGLTQGLYLLRVSGSQKSFYQKLIKQ